MSLAPMNEESAWLNEGKNHIGKKIVSHLSAYDVTCVISLDTNNLNSLTAKSVLAGEKLVATYSIST
jgi:hypothetical protein